MYCSECGDKLEEGSRYCSKCGNIVGNQSDVEQDEEKVSINGIEERSIENQEKFKSKKVVMLGAIIGIVVITVVAIILLAMQLKKTDKEIIEDVPKITEMPNIDGEEIDDEVSNETAEKVPEIDLSEYIFPYSNTQLLVESDLENLSLEELGIARNEIIARHGRIYVGGKYEEYFVSKSWYKGTIAPEEFDKDYETIMSDIEKANVKLIQERENQLNTEAESKWKEAYLEVVQAKGITDLAFDHYVLFDIDDNGIPELIIFKGDSGYSMECSMFMFDSTKQKAELIHETIFSNPVCYANIDNNGMTIITMFQGIQVNHNVTLKNGKITVDELARYNIMDEIDDSNAVWGDTPDEKEIMRYDNQVQLMEYLIFDYSPLQDTSSAQQSNFSVNDVGIDYVIYDHSNPDDVWGAAPYIAYDDVFATSTLVEEGYNYDVRKLFDRDNDTCWAEGVAGTGIGEHISFSPLGKSEMFDTLYITTGYRKSEKTFWDNACPTKITVTIGDSSRKIDLTKYANSYEEYLLQPISIVFDGTYDSGMVECNVVIDEVREGRKYQDTCITEMFFGM